MLLLLFNPTSRAVRWYAAFNVTIMLWLGLQGWSLIHGASPIGSGLFLFAVHMMPAVFFAAALGEGTLRMHRWMPWAVLVLALAMFPLLQGRSWAIARYWQIALWCGAAAIYLWRALRGRARRGGVRRRTTRGEKILELVLSAFVPFGVAGALIAQGAFIIIVLPLLTVVVMLLIFSGVVFHRYYDIEVRAARTGELAASAAEQDRLALLGELSATIAHEVRNPLTGIRSLTQMIAEPETTEEKRVRYAGVILDEVGRLDRIVGNLTDLAKRESARTGTAAETTLASLFDDLRLLVQARAERGGVALAVLDTDVSVSTSREALAQALLNLLLNAIAHAPRGTDVTLAADDDGDDVAIHVSDRGPGVPEAERERIFEPFTTSGGTGLGLAVVRRLAEEQGWRVAVGDAPGGGARFTIRVPKLR